MKTLPVIAALAFASTVAVTALAQPFGTPPATGAQIFHIELNTLPGCYQYGCEGLFSDFATKEITILEYGHQYPVQVIPGDRPAFPTHLLVVFAAGARRPGNGALAKSLNQPLSRGWLVSVARTDGSFTPYCKKETLAQALAAPSTASSGNGAESRDLKGAIASLASFPGHRALLVVNARNAALPDWVSEAANAMASAYVVDGGEQRRAYFYTSNWGGLDDANTNWKTVTKRVFHEGIMHEVKLSSAMNDIVADARYDYDLSFSMPAPEYPDQGAPLPIRVELKERGTVTASGYAIAIPDSMRIGLYTAASRDAGGPAEQARIAVPQDPTVVWRCDFGMYPTVLFRIDGRDVLPRPTKPNGTVLVSYTAAAGLGTPNKSEATQAVSTAPQTLRLEASNLLDTEVSRPRSN